MKSTQWTIIIGIVVIVCFYGGYSMSARTGTEPGYFDAVEAAGYGGGGGEKIEGVSSEMSDYYKSLSEDE